MRIGEEDSGFIGGSFWRDRPLVRACGRFRALGSIFQIVHNGTDRPAEDHRASDGQRVPRFDIDRDRFGFVGMLIDVSSNPIGECF